MTEKMFTKEEVRQAALRSFHPRKGSNKHPTHVSISMPNELAELLSDLKGGRNGFTYAELVKFLLQKTGYVPIKDDELKGFKAMERYIEGKDE